MGARGPKGKSAKIRELEGNPGKRAMPKDFIYPDGDPARPEHLTGYAKIVWDRIVRSMPPGVYKTTDEELLAAYCRAAHLQKICIETLAIQGEVIVPIVRVREDEEGATIVEYGPPTRNPWSKIEHEARAQIATLGTRLGLDPISRENIKAPDKRPVSKFDGLTVVNGGKA